MIFVMDGTTINNLSTDGLKVVLPATAGASKSATLPAGIANGTSFPSNTEATGLGAMAQIAGICNYTIISFTRSASSVTWASQVYAIGDGLTVDTVNNALAWASSASAHGTPMPAFAVAQASTLASQSSTFGGAATVTTFALKTFLRVM